MKKSSILLILICLSFSSIAQDYVDLARFHYSTTPDNDFDSILGKSNIIEYGADITLPIQLNDSSAILTGLYLEQIKTRLHPQSDYETFSTINLKIGYNRKHSKKWSGTYLLLPKISSNFKELTGKDFQLGALLLMKYNKKENLKYNLGLYYNNELFGPFFVPLLGFYYTSSDKKLEINTTLPIWADVNYRLANWLNIGSNFTAFVRSYNMGNYNAYTVKKTNEIFGYLQFNIKKSILIQTKAGYSIGRSYKAYDENEKVSWGMSAFRFGDNRSVLNPTFNDGLVFKVRLIYRYHLN